MKTVRHHRRGNVTYSRKRYCDRAGSKTAIRRDAYPMLTTSGAKPTAAPEAVTDYKIPLNDPGG